MASVSDWFPSCSKIVQASVLISIPCITSEKRDLLLGPICLSSLVSREMFCTIFHSPRYEAILELIFEERRGTISSTGRDSLSLSLSQAGFTKGKLKWNLSVQTLSPTHLYSMTQMTKYFQTRYMIYIQFLWANLICNLKSWMLRYHNLPITICVSYWKI